MSVSDDVDEDPTGNKALWDRGRLNGASQKVRHFNLESVLILYLLCYYYEFEIESYLVSYLIARINISSV